MISYLRSQQILKKAPIKIGDEIINSENSLNRVLSLNIFSKHNYPAANNAAFDGFAVNSGDTKFLNKKSPQKFKIIGSMRGRLRSEPSRYGYPDRDRRAGYARRFRHDWRSEFFRTRPCCSRSLRLLGRSPDSAGTDRRLCRLSPERSGVRHIRPVGRFQSGWL